MKAIARGEILGLADYETVRERFRNRVIAEKKIRRVSVGPKVSVVFENRDTVLLQIQEMLRTERITRAASVQHEIDTYSALLPGTDELSCTLMVEIADHAERDAFLQAAKGLSKHVWVVAVTRRIAARSNEPSRDGPEADRTTAVHYLKFPLPSDVADALRARASGNGSTTELALEIDHPAYAARADLRLETLVALGEDLQA
ncbi:MAG: DUF3501 family protein [Polyangiaceae bacterium]